MEQKFWRLTVAFALATTFFSGFILPMFPSSSHSDVSGYGSPVFAFEMAQSIEDMISVFGPEGSPESVDRVAQMDKGNRWDYAFMFLYAFFLGCFCFAAYKQSGKSFWLVPAVIGIASGVFDAFENIILLKLTDNFDSPSLLSILWLPVYAKFTAIALSSFAAALYIFQSTAWAWRVIGLISMTGAAATFLALLSPSEFGWVLRHSITLSWVPLLIYGLVRSVIKPPKTPNLE